MYRLEDITNTLICGNSLTELKNIPDKSIDLVVTSPPYYKQRSYHNNNQIGQEESVTYYLDNLISVFGECKRVLKNTGSLWVNIADSYNSKQSLCGVPERLCIRLKDELNYTHRNTIIWHKPNCMPSSAKNRFTIDFEYFLFMVISSKYYFETQYQPYADSTLEQFKTEYKGKGIKDYGGNGVQNPSDVKRRIIKFGGDKYPNNVENATYSGNEFVPKKEGSIRRTTWRISPNNYKGAHFATYPEKLIETPIKACTKENDLVLDPFSGSGTTCAVAKKMGRRYLGIDINQDYITISENRLRGIL